jgi:hypothetical protein
MFNISNTYGRSGETSRDIGDILDSYQEITSINPNTNLNWAKLKDIESIPDQHYDNESIAG